MEFWAALSLMQKIYFCIGLAASVFLILQIITLLFGIGDTGEADVDLDGAGDGDGDVEIGDGFNLFTFRGLVAFFAIGGWTGFALAEVSVAIAIVGSLVAGTIALFIMAIMMRGIMKLRSSGNIDNSKAIGSIADVYLTIPAKDGGCGKITMTLEERFVELSAMQNGEEPIVTGSKVKVVAVLGDTLVVEKI